MATNFNLLKIGQYHASLETGECKDATIVIANSDGKDISIKLKDMASYVGSAQGVDQLNELVGSYAEMPDIHLAALETNKVINASGVKTDKAGWAIAEFTAQLGNVYLFNPGATDADVCVFAEKIDKVETRGIDYAYTYDAKGNPLTAKATYNGATHSYTYANTYTTNNGTESLSVVITDDQTGKQVEYLPQTYQTSVGAYQPMVRLNENAELPKDGYCRFVSNFQTSDAIRIAVSYKVDSADLTMKVVRSGMVASMCTQLSKINQKVDETAKAIDKSIARLEIYSLEDGTILLDGVEHTVHKGRLNVFTGFQTLHIATEGDRDLSRLSHATYFKLSGNVRTTGLGFLYKCETIDLSEAYITSSQAYLLESCSVVKKLKINGEFTRSLGKFLYNCNALEELDLSGCRAHDFREMWYMCSGLNGLKRLDITMFEFDRDVTEYSKNCVNCQNLVDLYLPESFFSLDTDVFDMSNLQSWNGISVDYSLIDHIYDRAANGLPTATIKLSSATYKQISDNGLLDGLAAKGYTITM